MKKKTAIENLKKGITTTQKYTHAVTLHMIKKH